MDKIIERIPTKTPEHIKAFLQRERKHLNYTIESRFVESDGSSIVLDDGEKGKVPATAVPKWEGFKTGRCHVRVQEENSCGLFFQQQKTCSPEHITGF